MRKLCLTMLALAAVPLYAQDVEHWELSQPRMAIRFNAGLLRDIGVRLTPAGRPVRDGYVAHEFGVDGRMSALAPSSVFSTVESGELRLTSGPTLSFQGEALRLAGTTVRPGREARSFVFTAPDGTPVFVADHQHHEVDRRARSLHLFNLDLKLSRELAGRLGNPRFAGLAVGVLEIQMRAAIPAATSDQPPLGACVTDWGAPDNDVGLIGMGVVQQQARDAAAGLVAIAPSATLKNVGVHSVPWIQKFSAPLPPYNNDQHPMLVWNMYRVANGAIQQIGASGMKHAFLTINSNCGCVPTSSHILFTACEDVYSTSNNNDSTSLGPRTELIAHLGLWDRCGSVFDTNCDGQPNNVPPFQGAGDKRRLVVTDADLQTSGAQYFFEAWYVVRDDVNIFNTMGYRQVGPSFSGTAWSFSLLTPLISGPAIDAWVNPTNPGINADSQRINTGEGRLTLAARATDVGGGRWRYDYALMNHDFDRRIRSFSVPLPAGAVVTNATFHDVDRDAATDWTANVVPDTQIIWAVPQNGVRRTEAPLDWGMLDTFSFEVNAPPTGPQGVVSLLSIAEAPVSRLRVQILGPAAQ